MERKKKLGIALVGLGNYSTHQLAPALRQTESCYLAAVVTGSPEKAAKWKDEYKLPARSIYNYEQFDSLRDNPDVDIVYVVLPNSMHAEYTIRAARADKHVVCEKPMATSVEDCDRMIEACRKAGKKLSIGYRLHFEPYNREMMRLGQDKIFGEIRSMKAAFGFPVGDNDQWRLKKDLAGGGPMVDVGIYCLQAFCYVSGMEPVAVSAVEGPRTDREKFDEVEESLTWRFEMPRGIIAEGTASYAEKMNFLRVEAANGWYELYPAFHYSGQHGRRPEGEMEFPHVNQQALQMDDFARSILEDRPTPVPGEMGRRDVRIIQAVYTAMRTKKRVVIEK